VQHPQADGQLHSRLQKVTRELSMLVIEVIVEYLPLVAVVAAPLLL
jgi:hypothetical protein